MTYSADRRWLAVGPTAWEHRGLPRTRFPERLSRNHGGGSQAASWEVGLTGLTRAYADDAMGSDSFAARLSVRPRAAGEACLVDDPPFTQGPYPGQYATHEGLYPRGGRRYLRPVILREAPGQGQEHGHGRGGGVTLKDRLSPDPSGGHVESGSRERGGSRSGHRLFVAMFHAHRLSERKGIFKRAARLRRSLDGRGPAAARAAPDAAFTPQRHRSKVHP